MKCPDCNGGGKYYGLNSLEDCQRCGGTGQESGTPAAVNLRVERYTLKLAHAKDAPKYTPGHWVVFANDGVSIMAMEPFFDMLYDGFRTFAYDFRDAKATRTVYSDEDRPAYERLAAEVLAAPRHPMRGLGMELYARTFNGWNPCAWKCTSNIGFAELMKLTHLPADTKFKMFSKYVQSTKYTFYAPQITVIQ